MEISAVLKAVGRPINYWPIFCKAFGDSKTGIFLSNFLYWEGKQKDPDGWIYKTQKEILDETGLERTGQEYARKKLRELDCLEEKRAGTPAKLYYRFNWDEIDKVVNGYISHNPVKMKKKKKTPEPSKEPKPDPILYRMKVIFDEAYKTQTELDYNWPKDKGGGKDWKHLKLLMQAFERQMLAKRKEDNLQEEVTEDEIVASFEQFIQLLPKWHRENNLTPAGLYSNFSKIVLDVKKEYKRKHANSSSASEFAS